jgi:hypothetical protein
MMQASSIGAVSLLVLSLCVRDAQRPLAVQSIRAPRAAAPPRAPSCARVCSAALCLRGGVAAQSGEEGASEEQDDENSAPVVVRPLMDESEIPRGSPAAYALADELMSVATERMGKLDMFWQTAESLTACSDDDSLDSDNPINRVTTICNYLIGSFANTIAVFVT